MAALRETLGARNRRRTPSKGWGRCARDCQLRILSPLKPFFQHENKIKAFSDKQKPSEFTTKALPDGVLKNKLPEQRKRSPAGILRCQKKMVRGERVGKFKQTLKIQHV